MATWIKDDNGNRCSMERFGSEEAAKAALATLVGCSRCSDCSDCSDCSRCSDCSDCSEQDGGAQAAPAIPRIENIHNTVQVAVSAPGALDMGTWHACNTTHCRAGWVVHLAGEAGYALERFHNTALAAQLIYRESSPLDPVSPVRFYETNEVALADIKRMAELESAL